MSFERVPAQAPPVVLSVDDRPASLYARDRVLRARGFSVANATSGKATLDMAERIRPSVILLDVHLGDMDGREVCRQLKADAQLKDIPVVLISSTLAGHAQQLDSIMWGGADALIIEPAEPDMIESTLRKVLHLAWPTE